MRSTGDGCQLDNIEASAEPCTELKDLRIRHMQDICLSHSLGIVRTRPSRNFFHWETNEGELQQRQQRVVLTLQVVNEAKVGTVLVVRKQGAKYRVT